MTNDADDAQGPIVRGMLVILAIVVVVVLAGMFVLHRATLPSPSEERGYDVLPLGEPIPTPPADLDRPMTEPAEL